MYRTDDPVRDFLRHEDKREKESAQLPKCSDCGEPILTEECYVFYGEFICPGCLEENHLKYVADYVDEI